MSIKQFVPKFIEPALNLQAVQYTIGQYNNHIRHAGDIPAVLNRGLKAGVQQIVITGGDLTESEHAIKLARTYDLTATVGLHPSRTDQFSESYLSKLRDLLVSNLDVVVAFGECGLDYDRLYSSTPAEQIHSFSSQLRMYTNLSEGILTKLPLFLHSRSAHVDFVLCIKQELPANQRKGVVHSFTGTLSEMQELLSLGFYIGVNGCSLKTEENLQVVAKIPLDRLILETDGPWCSINTTHASYRHLASLPEEYAGIFQPISMKLPKKGTIELNGQAVKGRTEPCHIGQVAWVVSKIQQIDLKDVCDAAFRNSLRLFPSLEAKLHDSNTVYNNEIN